MGSKAEVLENIMMQLVDLMMSEEINVNPWKEYFMLQDSLADLYWALEALDKERAHSLFDRSEVFKNAVEEAL